LLILRLIDDDAAFVVNRKCWNGSDVAEVIAAISGRPLQQNIKLNAEGYIWFTNRGHRQNAVGDGVHAAKLLRQLVYIILR